MYRISAVRRKNCSSFLAQGFPSLLWLFPLIEQGWYAFSLVPNQKHSRVKVKVHLKKTHVWGLHFTGLSQKVANPLMQLSRMWSANHPFPRAEYLGGLDTATQSFNLGCFWAHPRTTESESALSQCSHVMHMNFTIFEKCWCKSVHLSPSWLYDKII